MENDGNVIADAATVYFIIFSEVWTNALEPHTWELVNIATRSIDSPDITSDLLCTDMEGEQVQIKSRNSTSN